MKILAAGVALFFRKDLTRLTIATPNWFANEPRKCKETNTFRFEISQCGTGVFCVLSYGT